MLRRSYFFRVGLLVFVVGLWANSGVANAQCVIQRLSTDDVAPYYTLGFGGPVAIGESYAVVAAKFSGFGPIDVNSGYVYVYELVNGRWIEEVRLSPSDGTLTDGFGWSVSISGDRILVGARGGGAAYIFHRTDTGWTEETKLLKWDNDPLVGFFGQSVSISGDVAVIGEASADELANDAGAAYVFRRTKAGWVPEQKLTAGDATVNDFFGWSVAVDGATILVASIGHAHDAKGSGWAYAFRYDGTDWMEEDHFTGIDTTIGDVFGALVALHGSRALVGAPYQDDPAENIGAAYVFRREGAKWVQEAKLRPSNSRSGDFIGTAIAFNNQLALLRGFNDDESSAHVFERTGSSWFQKCRLLAGATPTALSSSYAFLRHRGDVIVYTLSDPCHSLAEVAALQRCFSDEGTFAPLGCEDFDIDLDGDVDLEDYNRFRENLVGPGDSCQ